MSFDPVKLAILPSPAGFTSWHYETEDDTSQLAAPGYFNIAAGKLRRGDMIFSSGLISGMTGLFLVITAAEERVSVEPLHAEVTSVFGRTGAVTAAAGDYSPAQVGAPPVARQIATGGSLTGGGDLSANRTVTLVGDATNPGNSKYYGTNGSGAKGFHDLPAAAVSSVFGRTGAIAAQTGDYTAAQVGAVPTTAKGAANGVASLDGSAKLTLSQLPTHAHAIVDVTGLQAALDARASAREAKVAAYTVTTTGVGLDESVVIGKATSAITLTLTTNTGSAKKLSVTNRGTAPLTIAAGSGQTIRGGTIVLQPATGALTPSSVCLVRDPSDNAWLVI